MHWGARLGGGGQGLWLQIVNCGLGDGAEDTGTPELSAGGKLRHSQGEAESDQTELNLPWDLEL